MKLKPNTWYECDFNDLVHNIPDVIDLVVNKHKTKAFLKTNCNGILDPLYNGVNIYLNVTPYSHLYVSSQPVSIIGKIEEAKPNIELTLYDGDIVILEDGSVNTICKKDGITYVYDGIHLRDVANEKIIDIVEKYSIQPPESSFWKIALVGCFLMTSLYILLV